MGEIGWVPSGALAAPLEASLIMGAAHEVEGEGAHDRHVLGPMPVAQARVVLAEEHIQHPMQAGLDAPMQAHGLSATRRRERGGGDVKAPLDGAAVAPLDPGLHQGDRRQLGNAGRAGEAMRAAPGKQCGPVSQSTWRETTQRRVSMRPWSLSTSTTASTASGWAVSKKAAISPCRVGWFSLTAKR